KAQHVKWPTPKVFAAFVKWPGVSPFYSEEVRSSCWYQGSEEEPDN
ncbi:hypothetical protein A2U01_0059514, partial [Trifolium medium]|nr:hypothetical protein [Trifolium medium]